ncbi:MAG: hypothetical protein ACKO27_10320 [Ilumatobacteraceae bacterium]
MATGTAPGARHTRHLAARRATSRRLVIVDIENAVGGAEASADDVRTALAVIHQIVGRCDGDVWVVGCGPTLLTTAMGVLPRNVLLGRGVDGADNRLLEHLAPERVVGSFSSVVLVSGDGRAFAQPVTALRRAGVPTDLVVGRGGLGGTLRAAARQVLALESASFTLAA